MEASQERRKLIRIVGIVVIVLAIVLFIFLVLREHSRNRPGYDNRYYDKYSGKTLSDINGKSPEKAGGDDGAPLYLGFETLIDHGFSQEEVATIQIALNRFTESTDKKVEHVSFDVKSYQREASSGASGNSVVSFNVVLDFKDKYAAKLESLGVDSIKLQLSDSSGKNVYTYDDSRNPDETGPHEGS